jgi:hypothetical protein
MILNSISVPLRLEAGQLVCILGVDYPAPESSQLQLSNGVVIINGYRVSRNSGPYSLNRRQDVVIRLLCQEPARITLLSAGYATEFTYYYLEDTPVFSRVTGPLARLINRQVVVFVDNSQFVFQSLLNRCIQEGQNPLVLDLNNATSTCTPIGTIGYIDYQSTRMSAGRVFFTGPVTSCMSAFLYSHFREVISLHLTSKRPVLINCFDCSSDTTYPELSRLLCFLRCVSNDIQFHIINDERLFYTQLPEPRKSVHLVPLLRTYRKTPGRPSSIPLGITVQLYQPYRLPPESCLPLSDSGRIERTLKSTDYWSEEMSLDCIPTGAYFAVIEDMGPSLLDSSLVEATSIIIRNSEYTLIPILGTSDFLFTSKKLTLVDTRISTLIYTQVIRS